MKLHLNKILLAAVLACMAAGNTAWATMTTTTNADGTKTYTYSGPHESVNLQAPTPTDKIVLNLVPTATTPNSSTVYFSNGGWECDTPVEIQALEINNGYSGSNGNTYTFSGKITGAANSYFKFTGSPTGQRYVFNGDMSEYYGTMSINATSTGQTARQFTFNGIQVGSAGENKAGAITAGDLTSNNNVVNINGSIMYGSVTTPTLNVGVHGSKTESVFHSNVTTTTTTINNGVRLTLADNAILTVGTLTNNGTIVFSDNSKLDTGIAYEIGQTYNFGALENLTRSRLVGLGGRADVTYDSTSHDITVTGTIGDLVWKSGSGNLTDANAWTWNGEDASFVEGDKVTVSGSGKAVTISGTHQINTLTISDGGSISLAADANINVATLSISGSTSRYSAESGASLVFAETAEISLEGTNMSLVNLGGSTKHFTKKGSGTLTLTGNGLIGATGTVNVEGGTLAVTSHANGTAALAGADVTVKAGGTLSLAHDTLGWDGNRTNSITLIGAKDNVAKLYHNSTNNTTFQVVLNMNGYATVDGSGKFNTYRQNGDTTSGIFVTNNNNTFAAELGIRGPLTIDVARGGALDFTGKLAKNTQDGGDLTKTVTKTGGGDLNLSNSDNDYDGAFTVSGGTLRLVDGASATSSTLTINSGATLAYKGDGTLGSTVTFDSSAKLVVETGTLTVNRALSLSSGSVTLQSGTLDFNGEYSATLGTVALWDAGNLEIKGGYNVSATVGSTGSSGKGAAHIYVKKGTLTFNDTVTIGKADSNGNLLLGDSADEQSVGKLGVANGKSLTYNGVTYTATGADSSISGKSGVQVSVGSDKQTFSALSINLAGTGAETVRAAMADVSLDNARENIVLNKASVDGGHTLVNVKAGDLQSGNTSVATVTTIGGNVDVNNLIVGGGTTTINGTGTFSLAQNGTIQLWNTATFKIDNNRTLDQVAIATMKGAKLAIANGTVNLKDGVAVLNNDTVNGNIQLGTAGDAEKTGKLGIGDGKTVTYKKDDNNIVSLTGSGSASAVSGTQGEGLSLGSTNQTFSNLKVAVAGDQTVKAAMGGSEVTVKSGTTTFSTTAQSSMAALNVEAGAAADVDVAMGLSGASTVAGDMTVSKALAIGDNASITVSGNGSMSLAGGTITGSNVTISTAQAAAPAEQSIVPLDLGGDEGEGSAPTGATLSNVTISNSGITAADASKTASISDAEISLSGTDASHTASLTGVDLNDSKVTLGDYATLSGAALDNTTVSVTGTGARLDNVNLTDSTVEVATGAALELADVVMTGSSVNLADDTATVSVTGDSTIVLTRDMADWVTVANDTATLTLTNVSAVSGNLTLNIEDGFMKELETKYYDQTIPTLTVDLGADMASVAGVAVNVAFPAASTPVWSAEGSAVSITFTPAIPEPATAALSLLALAGLAARRRRKA